MFTGIIKAQSKINSVWYTQNDLKIRLDLPSRFEDLFPQIQPGESLSLDGVCLTLEELTSQGMTFHLGHETLAITKWSKQSLLKKSFNLEPPLRWGHYMGGHLVAGHVDGLATLLEKQQKQASTLLTVEIPAPYQDFFWPKGFIALNGVSLTVNQVQGPQLSICLIPETLKNTNLSHLTIGDSMTFEVDSLSRSVVSAIKKYFLTQKPK